MRFNGAGVKAAAGCGLRICAYSAPGTKSEVRRPAARSPQLGTTPRAPLPARPTPAARTPAARPTARAPTACSARSAAAYSTVPAPSVPPRAQPTPRTDSSTSVRTRRTGHCSRAASPERESVARALAEPRGDVDAREPAAQHDARQMVGEAPNPSDRRRHDRQQQVREEPISTMFATVPAPGRMPSGSDSRSTARPTAMLAIPMPIPRRRCSPCGTRPTGRRRGRCGASA